MKTSRLGSMCPRRVVHRLRLRATSGRFCALASTVFFEAEAFAADKCPDGAVVDPRPAPGKLATRPRRVNAAAVRATSHARWAPAIFGGTWPPILPGATLPVARSVHFTTRDGATLSAHATFRTLAPAAIRATARSRRSLDRPSSPASNPANSLNQKPCDSGIPNRFRPASSRSRA
jgi:hypothetical protein